MALSEDVPKAAAASGGYGNVGPAAAAPAARGDFGDEVAGPNKILASTIHQDPKVTLFENFVSQDEVDHLLRLCEGRWARSMVSKGKASDLHGANSTSLGEEAVGETRTSCSVHLEFNETIVTERIAARVATVTGVSLEQVEPLVVLRYEPGQFFKLHHDGSMRPSTVFVYFNGLGPDGGGETSFPHLGFQVKPSAHTALMWTNRTPDGDADLRLKHEAKPVKEGVKYAMNCFVNMKPQRDASNIVIVQQKEEEAPADPQS
eukprot:TRINITY_DN949_c1_g1_i1.p1 TRINITY_DN949_c1_g1~~TRINITY_DN949_c1_g1_i1.p1  ORF type:complete len:261 (+),score=66.83 TRINITY_DN949_c1_g1_i1:58-840(+)